MSDEQSFEQDALFNPPADPVAKNHLGPWARGSTTSRQAALDNYPHSGTQRRKVLDAITAAAERGCTRPELAMALHLPENSIRPRVVELLERGFVVETNRTRLTHTGSKASVLVANTDKGNT